MRSIVKIAQLLHKVEKEMSQNTRIQVYRRLDQLTITSLILHRCSRTIYFSFSSRRFMSERCCFVAVVVLSSLSPLHLIPFHDGAPPWGYREIGALSNHDYIHRCEGKPSIRGARVRAWLLATEKLGRAAWMKATWDGKFSERGCIVLRLFARNLRAFRQLRRLVNGLWERCTGRALVFAQTRGAFY